MEHVGDGKSLSDQLLTHCRRELFHAQWKDILDDEFLQAYEHGIVFMCGDGIKRRLFPRIFTYSADYPEKYIIFFWDELMWLKFEWPRVLIANIRNLGGCPCPRCITPKDQFQNVATANDMLRRDTLSRHDTEDRRSKIMSARRLIYEDQYVVDTPQVEALLKPQSLVPTIVSILLSSEWDQLPTLWLRIHFRND
jgi:Plavaka transposase